MFTTLDTNKKVELASLCGVNTSDSSKKVIFILMFNHKGCPFCGWSSLAWLPFFIINYLHVNGGVLNYINRL